MLVRPGSVPVLARYFVRLLLVLNLLLAPAAFAAWPPEGARLTGAPGGSQMPVVVADGSGGAFVSWGQRDPIPDRFRGYLQHVTASGEIAPGWPADGLLVADGPGGGGAIACQPDGWGGVYVAIVPFSADYAENDLYLQRYTAAGAVQPGWPTGGVPVVVAPGIQGVVSVVGNEAGGVWISWDDQRDPSRAAACLTHVLPSGEISPGWPLNGLDFDPVPLVTGSLLMLPLADGGFLGCWGFVDDPALIESGLRGQRYDAAGLPDASWPEGGVVARGPVPYGGPPRGIARDGAGGFYVAWEDRRAYAPPYVTDPDIYAQHVRADGTLAPGWPADGLPVAVLPGVTQQVVTLCEDGAGGVYIAWEDYRDGYARIYGQHLAPDGTPYPGWPAGGRPISNLNSFQLRPSMVWDGEWGAYVVWSGQATGSYATFVSKLTPYGTPAPGWPEEGLRASTLIGNTEPAIAADGFGGAIVAWEQGWPFPPGGVDVYAQRFVRDGIVAASASLVSAEATPSEVRLVWAVNGVRAASVERREQGGAWETRTTLDANGEGRLEFTDTTVVPGTAYEYRLAFADGTSGGLATVAVPHAFALALEGAHPNPARGAPQVAFTLPDAQSAQLALYDLAGRRLAAREVGGLGAGRHVVRIDEAALAPGLYWATLARGGEILRARIAVVR